MTESSSPNYRPGMSIACPSCGRSSVVKVTTKMDGWTPVGRFFTCALCSAELGPAESAHTSPAKSRTRDEHGSIDRLSAFLSQQRVEKKAADQALGVTEDATRFCKDCRHFYRHPFIDKCLLHERPTGPMDDCPDYERKPAEESDD